MGNQTIIIPVHNRRDTTLACLRHLLATGDLGRSSVIVVDDGSDDGTSEAVSAEFPEVQILRGDGSLWWTGAIALGMQRASAAGTDAICWLNDDCLPAPGTLDELFNAAGVAGGQVVAPACFNADTGEPVANAFVGRKRVSVASEQHQRVAGLSGFCVALPRAVWARIGLPDPVLFPHYFGDNAYTIVAVRAGFPVVVIGSLRAELTSFHAPPSLRAMGERTRGWRARWARVFASPKSPYRLRTLLAFQRLKYGWIAGSVVAGVRGAGWIARMLWMGIRS